jgi:hypothetical protein
MAGAKPEAAKASLAVDTSVGGDETARTARQIVRGHPISGLSALFLVAAAVSIFLLARWAGQPGEDGLGHRSIQGLYGLLVAVTLGVLILAYAWAHKLAHSVAIPSKARPMLRRILGPLGWLFTQADFLLVLTVANVCGAGPFGAERRIAHFLLYFGTALAAAWLLPPPWGLVGVLAALVGILALNRKWAWVEEDRRNYVLSGHYDVSASSNLGIGFEHDYRGVALSALALMIVIVPLALMQMAAFGLFETKDGTPISDLSTLEWFVFFGGEMAKSVPFVDWSEVYGAETVTPIVAQPGGGQHAVFFVRALVDLVLLAGFLQALDLSNRLARQQASFHEEDNPQRILDPFQERDAFRDIAKFAAPKIPTKLETDLIGGLEERLGPFARYDNEQIQRILRRGEAPEFWRPDHESAAAMIVPYREVGGPAPQFFVQLYESGFLFETVGAQAQQRDVAPRTQIAAIIAALGNETVQYASAYEKARAKLPSFLESDDERVWSGAACAIAEIRNDLAFPYAAAEDAFKHALAKDAAEREPRRTLLLHQALAYLANAQRPTRDRDDGRPHLGWTVGLLVEQIRDLSDIELRRSAVTALGEIKYKRGSILDAAQAALGTLAQELKPHSWSWRRLIPWLEEHRLRRLAERTVAKISAPESMSP